MKIVKIFLVAIVICCFVLPFDVVLGETYLCRTWKYKGGVPINARYVKYEGGRVYLQMYAGETKGFDYAYLSNDDQKYVSLLLQGKVDEAEKPAREEAARQAAARAKEEQALREEAARQAAEREKGQTTGFDYNEWLKEMSTSAQPTPAVKLFLQEQKLTPTTPEPFNWESDIQEQPPPIPSLASRRMYEEVTRSQIALLSNPLFWFVIFVATMFCILMSFSMERKLKKRLPNTRPYKWGFFVGCLDLVAAAIMLLMFFIDTAVGDKPLYIAASVIGVIFGYYIIKRKRWAWGVGTILTMNPIGWMINGIYAARRWREFTAEAAGGTSEVSRISGKTEHPEGQAATPQESQSCAKVVVEQKGNNMNTQQKFVMWTGVAIILASCLCPPWLYTFTKKDVGFQTKPAGYALLFSPPAPEKGAYHRELYGVRLDGSRLLLQILAVAVVTAGLMISFKGKRTS